MTIEKEARRLRIGVLGCGPIAQAAHFEACRRARNAELYAICDLAEDLVARMSAIHEPHVTYLDYDEMLADPQVEAIIVATADQFHVEHASRALAAGKHVLVEKPLGVTVEKFGAYCWFVATEFADGSVGHLDLTMAVRMDWHEGFQVYGEYGSVIGKTPNPWYLRSSDVECFSVRDGQYHRLLGADAHVYRLQLEGFADTILHGTPLHGAVSKTALQLCGPPSRSRLLSKPDDWFF